jgi:hypothetical protein
VYIYSVAILVKGNAEVGGIVGTVGAFSTYRRDDVDLLNNTTLTGQSYFRNLSRVTFEYKLPAAATNQTPQKKSNKKQHVERVFADAALNIIKPTAIYAVLKFRGTGNLQHRFDFADPESAMRRLIEWSPTTEREYFKWKRILQLTLTYCSKYIQIVESSHYVPKGV